MNKTLIVLQETDKAALAAVRCAPGIEAALHNGEIWLGGITEKTEVSLRQLPIKKTYLADDKLQLYLPDGITPVAILPALVWQPLPTFLPVTVPVSAMPGNTSEKITVNMKPSDTVRPGMALRTTLAVLKSWAANAAEVRLQCLQFAVSEQGDVFITGQPLPPLPGTEFWQQNDFFIPAGYDFEIPLSAPFFAEKFNPGGDDILVFETNGKWQKIPGICLVPASRSAIRKS